MHRPSKVRDSIMFRTMDELIRKGGLSKNDSYLLVFAGDFDKAVLDQLGVIDYCLTNVSDDPINHADSRQDLADARQLSYPDSFFDHVVAHAGLHHTSRPHQAVCEMYRCARKSVLFFEAQDSIFMRLAVRLGLVAKYEWNAIFDSDGKRGGVDDSPVPNYVYRWTRREVEKLIRSLDPFVEPRFSFFREWDIYFDRLARRLSRTPIGWLPESLVRFGCWVFVKTLNATLGFGGNSFVVCIHKGQAKTQPWIKTVDGDRVFDSQAVHEPPPSSI